MASLVETFRQSLARMQGLLSTDALQANQRKVAVEQDFYRSCRIRVGDQERAKYRVCVVVRTVNCDAAEREAELHVRELLHAKRNELGEEYTVRWVTARPIANPRGEPEAVRNLLACLRQGASRVVSHFESFET